MEKRDGLFLILMLVVLIAILFIFSNEFIFTGNQVLEMNNVYNVKDFGAKGDNFTDDTIPIRNAINEAGIDGGGEVFFPAGIYHIMPQTPQERFALNISYDNIELAGEGPEKSVLSFYVYGHKNPLNNWVENPEMENKEWVATFSESSLAPNFIYADDSVYITGKNSEGKMYFVKYRKSGDILFEKNLPSVDEGKAVLTDWSDEKNIYLLGKEGNGAYLTKVRDSDGSKLWEESIDNFIPNKLIMNSFYDRKWKFYPIILGNAGTRFSLIKYDEDGEKVDDLTSINGFNVIDSEIRDEILFVTGNTQTGNIYSAAFNISSMNEIWSREEILGRDVSSLFLSSDGVFISGKTDSNQIYLVKYSIEGEKVWEKINSKGINLVDISVQEFYNQYDQSVLLKDKTLIYVAGYSGNNDFITLVYDFEGNLIEELINSNGNIPKKIARDRFDNFYVIGEDDNKDFFIVKYNSEFEQEKEFIIGEGKSLSAVYSENPFVDRDHVYLTGLGDNGKPITIKFDLTGEMLHRGTGIRLYPRNDPNNPLKDTVIRDLRLTGNSPPNGDHDWWSFDGMEHGWDVTHKGLELGHGCCVNNTLIKNFEIDNWKGEIIYGGGYALGEITIDNVKIHGTNADGISMGNKLTVKNSEIYDFVEAGFENLHMNRPLEGYTPNYGIYKNNTIECLRNYNRTGAWSAYGKIGAALLNEPSKQEAIDNGAESQSGKLNEEETFILFENNKIKNCKDYAVYSQFINNALFENNTIIDSGIIGFNSYVANPYGFYEAQNVTFNRNNFVSDKRNYLTGFGMSISNLKNVEILNSQFSNYSNTRYNCAVQIGGNNYENYIVANISGYVDKPSCTTGNSRFVGQRPLWKNNDQLKFRRDSGSHDDWSFRGGNLKEIILHPTYSSLFLVGNSEPEYTLSFLIEEDFPKDYPEGFKFSIRSEDSKDRNFIILEDEKWNRLTEDVIINKSLNITLIMNEGKWEIFKGDSEIPEIPSTEEYSCGENQLRGDVNGDNKIDERDSEIIFNIFLNKQSKPKDICCGDVAGKKFGEKIIPDGKIDSVDGVLIVNHAKGNFLLEKSYCNSPTEKSLKEKILDLIIPSSPNHDSFVSNVSTNNEEVEVSFSESNYSENSPRSLFSKEKISNFIVPFLLILILAIVIILFSLFKKKIFKV